MNDNVSEKNKEATNNYDFSELSTYLKYDTWHANLGIPLMCDINIAASPVRQGEVLDDSSDWPANFSVSPPSFNPISLLSENRFLTTNPTCQRDNFESHSERVVNKVAKKIRRDPVSFRPLPEQPFKTSSPSDVAHVLSARWKAYIRMRDTWGLFFSNSDHIAEPVRSPKYFLDWAAEKNIHVPWRAWAESEGYLNDNSSMPDSSGKPEKLDKRWEDSLLATIAALLDKLDIDPNKRGISPTVEGITKDFGAHVKDKTMRKILAKIDNAVDSVKDR